MKDDKTVLIDLDFNDFKNEKLKSCIIIEGDLIGKIFNLVQRRTIIGRGQDADIVLDSSTVSRRHAELSIVEQEGIVIQDLNSSNGTYVNGKKITQSLLHEGDIFSVGIYKLKIALLSKHDTLFFQRMTDSAEKDGLTGLYNKSFITKYLNSALTQPGYGSRMISIAMADIDHFKEINDTYGHVAGDAVLKDIAGIFCSSVRSADKSARFGGEEFLIVFDRTSMDDACIISERIRQRVMDHSTLYGSLGIKATISIGLACNGGKRLSDAESLIQRADAKLYEAKHNGRNRVVH